MGTFFICYLPQADTQKLIVKCNEQFLVLPISVGNSTYHLEIHLYIFDGWDLGWDY